MSIKLPVDNKNDLNIEYYVVDTITIRIGKSKNSRTYSGYKELPYLAIRQLLCARKVKYYI